MNSLLKRSSERSATCTREMRNCSGHVRKLRGVVRSACAASDSESQRLENQRVRFSDVLLSSRWSRQKLQWQKSTHRAALRVGEDVVGHRIQAAASHRCTHHETHIAFAEHSSEDSVIIVEGVKELNVI